MKVTGSNLSPSDSAIEKTRGKAAETVSPKRDQTGPYSFSSHEDILQIQRSISKDQLVLGALEQLKVRLVGADEIPASFLTELRQSTRMGKMMVLEPYESVLQEILSQKDTARLEDLIDTTRRRISLTIASLAKDQIAAQNILSAKPTGEDLSELLRKIVVDLKKKGDPGIHLERTRILDLLG
jgi:hypothetical protein